jgi:hypothetical protein
VHFTGPMIGIPLPLAPEDWTTPPAPEPALQEPVATLRLENATLREENAVVD